MIELVASFLFGLIVGILGAVISNFFVWPIRRQLEEVGAIADSLTFYANIYSWPRAYSDNKQAEIQLRFRTHATRLLSFTVTIPWYGFLQALGFVRKRQNVKKAVDSLIGLSNMVTEKDYSYRDQHWQRIDKTVVEIQEWLKIKL